MSGLSITSGFTLSPTLAPLIQNLTKTTPGEPLVQCIKIKIHTPHLDLDTFVASDEPITVDWLKTDVSNDSPRFYLMRGAGVKRWCLISWVPDGAVKVRDRMAFASSKVALIEAIGASLVTSTFHFTGKSDILRNREDLGNALGHKQLPGQVKPRDFEQEIPIARRDLLSKVELSREHAREQEDIARDELKARLTGQAMGSGINPLAQIQSGGFHHVSLQLTSNAKEALDGLAQAKFGFIELAVTDDKSGVECITSHPTDSYKFFNSTTQLPLGNKKQPRFYITIIGNENPKPDLTKVTAGIKKLDIVQKQPSFNENNSKDKDGFEVESQPDEQSEAEDKTEPETQEKKVEDQSENSISNSLVNSQATDQSSGSDLARTDLTYVLLYSCPPGSPPKLRMVYSTAMTQLISTISANHIPLNYKVEHFDGFKTNPTVQWLKSRIDTLQGATKLDVSPSLASLVHTSHNLFAKAKVDEEYQQQIKPSKVRIAHPIFGRANPN